MEVISLEWAYTISIGLLLLSTILSGVELVSIPGIYNSFVFPTEKIEESYKQVHYLLAVQTLGALLVFYWLLHGDLLLFKCGFSALTVLAIYTYKKRSISRNGADQLRILSYLVTCFCLPLDNHFRQLLPLLFLGGQILIAYTTSGIAKVKSPIWREGHVVGKVLSTFSFGIPRISKFLIDRPLLEKVLSYGAVVAMLGVPVCFLIPGPMPIIIALAVMVSFHFSTAVLMGLNDFFITFPLGYPGVILLHQLIFT